MSDKKYVVYYHEGKHKYICMNSLWFAIYLKYVKPILYSDDFELIEKVTRELNEQLQEQSN